MGTVFFNRMELQNGCLSRGHSNLFIPSTIHGEPYDSSGQFDEVKHCDNLDAAIEQYIARVDGTPCMGTKISLHKGMSRNAFIERRERLLIFLKGSAKTKAELKKTHRDEYKYFENVWKVRTNHRNKTLPSNYIFFLKCCGQQDCPHPLYKEFSTKEAEDKSFFEDVFCACRKPEGKKLMICCDQCGEWYH